MILLLVAGNVPGTLQFAARFPLRLVANEHGKSGRGFAEASRYRKLWSG